MGRLQELQSGSVTVPCDISQEALLARLIYVAKDDAQNDQMLFASTTIRTPLKNRAGQSTERILSGRDRLKAHQRMARSRSTATADTEIRYESV